MKSYLHIIFSLALAAVVAACSGFDDMPLSDNVITFLAAGDTKALDVTTVTLPSFTVEAFVHATEDRPHMHAVPFFLSGGVYESSDSYYWPEGEVGLDFYAYSAGSVPVVTEGTGQVVRRDWRTFSVTPAADPAAQADLVFACSTGCTKAASDGGAVALNFRHAGAKVAVKVKNTSSFFKFDVEAWEIGFLDGSAVFTYNAVADHPYDISTVGPGELPRSSWSYNDTPDVAYASSFSTARIGPGASATVLPGGMVLIPQAEPAAGAYVSSAAGAFPNGAYVAVKMKVVYTMAGDDTLALDDGEGGGIWALWPAAIDWQPGRNYTYTIDLAGGGYWKVNHKGDAGLDTVFDDIQIPLYAECAVEPWATFESTWLYATGVFSPWGRREIEISVN